MYWLLVLCQCHSDLNHAILYCVSNSTRHQWIVSKHIQLARSSYYNYPPLPSLCPTGYTSWPTPTSPYDWSYPYMSIPHLPLPPSHNCHKPSAATSPTNGRGNLQFKVCFIAGNISIPKASKDTCHSSALVVHSSLSLHQYTIMWTCHVFRKNGKCFNLCYTRCSIKAYFSTQGYFISVWWSHLLSLFGMCGAFCVTS